MRQVHIYSYFSLILVTTLVFGCNVNNADVPKKIDPPFSLNNVDLIAELFSEGDTQQYKRTIIESDGISQLYLVKSLDEWSVESVFKDTSQKKVLVNFTIYSSSDTEYLNCAKVSFEECDAEKESYSGTSEASYLFDLRENIIEVNVKNGLTSYAELSESLMPTDLTIRFDYNFNSEDTSIIVSEITDSEFSLVSGFNPAGSLDEIDFSSGDDCMFYKASISDQFDDFDITELSSCNSINQIKQDLYHFFPFSTGEQFNFERQIRFSSTYYEEERWNQKSHEIWKIKDDTFSESTLIRTIEFESTSLDSIDYEYWDPDTSIHSVVLDTTIYYSNLVLNYKERALKLKYPNDQFKRGEYSTNWEIPDSLNIEFHYDFKIASSNLLIRKEEYDDYVDRSYVSVLPGMGLKNIWVSIELGTPHSQTDWYFSLINKTEY